MPDRIPSTAATTTETALARIPLARSPDGFEPFGLILRHDGAAGHRSDFSGVFETLDSGLVPRLHINHVEASTLPLTVSGLERHPASWQTFIPLDVSRYLVCVAAPFPDGRPDPATLRAWILDGHTGVAFAPGIWHAGATVFDAPGRFAVIWPRRDVAADTETCSLPHPVRIEEG